MRRKRNKGRTLLFTKKFRGRLKRLRKLKSSKSTVQKEPQNTMQTEEETASSMGDIEVIEIEQGTGPSLAVVDMLEPIEGVNWKDFKKFNQMINSEDSNDIIEVPRICRSKKEIEEELKALKVKKKHKPNVPNFLDKQEPNEEEEIVFLGSFSAISKPSTSQQIVPETQSTARNINIPKSAFSSISSIPFHMINKTVPIQELRPFRAVVSEAANNKFIGRNGFNLRICTFNVLCEKTKNRHPNLYPDQSQQISWDHRKELLRSEFSCLNSSVYCCQEIQHDHFCDFFEPVFHKIGFKCVYTKRAGQNVDGCLLAYNTSMFKELSFEHIHYNYGVKNFNKDNVGQVILLEENQTGLKFIVANTHILFNMRRGDVKTGQVALLIASIDKVCSNLRSDAKFAGVFLCGDFNIEPNSAIYNFIRHGKLPYDTYTSAQLPLNTAIRVQTSQDVEIASPFAPFIVMSNVPLDPNNCEIIKANLSKPSVSVSTIHHKYNFLSSYKHITENDELEVSTYHRDNGCPDFIFYSGQQIADKVQEDRIMLRKILVLPTLKMIKETCGKMPNEQCGSDHLPLMAEFFVC